jgi:hypothetical protein
MRSVCSLCHDGAAGVDVARDEAVQLRLELSTMSSLCRRSTGRRWSGVQHADGRTPLSAERRTPSPEREAAISLAAGAPRARSTHAIGAERA